MIMRPPVFMGVVARIYGRTVCIPRKFVSGAGLVMLVFSPG